MTKKIFISIIVLMFGSCSYDYYANKRDVPFNKEKWQEAHLAMVYGGGHVEAIRHRMVHDLLSKKILIGKTKEEMIEILGNDVSFQYGYAIYWLNEEYNCWICIDPTDSYQLNIKFNDDGKIVEADSNY